MMFGKKKILAGGLVALASAAVILAGCASQEKEDYALAYYTQMSAAELAEHLIFEKGGFNLDQPTQEGTTVRERQTQDDLNMVCSEYRNRPPADVAGQIVTEARASMKYPEYGLELGDWRRGAELAWSGFGFRVGHNVDNHERREVGGNCYNCHSMSEGRTGGSLGPSLVGYGKTRGDSLEVRRFVYEMMYNPHAYFPCTEMPRMGHNGLLSAEAMADIMAYLLHPESPVNR
ncbi:monoheme cytochrome SoxX (sulfur oxidation) [Ectothiorhodosinus mongolicus]|uniref:Monoheme cytochrome SoxX (Sulfur oxidation) n=2 Tax=Ectothiorhodosinus mongolicus TaxID=233100 RepID=A0A1R3W430_9GAMM|nr:sulfur oxidation c-type cytochrome SoxX [Ectothiorhodosinus mongolicus]SIT72256.1 monoheme cytochrome SoxX (sulfur oxidation) [Ectothiorhodosinus mongolicus]